MQCRYFALCDLPAVGYYPHPAIGRVPVCDRCATRHGLTLEPLPLFDRTPPYFHAPEPAIDAARRSGWSVELDPDGFTVATTPAGDRLRLTLVATAGAHPFSWEPVR